MRKVPLRNRKGETVAHALVDDTDYEWAMQWRWSRHTDGYAQRGEMRKQNGKVIWQRTHLLHRAVLGLEHGDKRQTDHRNGNKLDCRRANLRIVTHAQNCQNLSHVSRGTSKHRGVCWNKAQGRWLAYASPRSGFINLGHFDSETEAAAVARAYREVHMPYSEEAA